GQRRNEGPEGALAHGIADHRGHGLLHGWTGNIGTASSTCAPPADWNSDFHRHIESVMPDLFDLETRQTLGDGAVLLRGRALDVDAALRSVIETVARQAPFRRMVTPGGFQMSVAMTNCGRAGWVTDRSGYRYDTRDPESGEAWPAMPPVFLDLARGAAGDAGFPDFVPDAC